MFSFFRQYYFVEKTILVGFFFLMVCLKFFKTFFLCIRYFFFSNSLLNLFINLSFVKFCYLCYLGDGLA